MNFSADHPLLLHRVDASRNMARFYALTLAPTLFGETALVRNWGRIGKRGQMCLNTFASLHEAEHAMARLHARKARRGYRPPHKTAPPSSSGSSRGSVNVKGKPSFE